MERRPASWMWGRLVGDLLEISAISAALTKRKNHHGLLSGALNSVLGITALDYVCAQRLLVVFDQK